MSLSPDLFTTSITAEYHFESAHFLPGVPATHKCSRMHGHNYKVHVVVIGVPDPQREGWVMDFAELDQVMGQLITKIDHRTLNEIDGLENPTAELIAAWFMQHLASHVIEAEAVTVYETEKYWSTVRRHNPMYVKQQSGVEGDARRPGCVVPYTALDGSRRRALVTRWVESTIIGQDTETHREVSFDASDHKARGI